MKHKNQTAALLAALLLCASCAAACGDAQSGGQADTEQAAGTDAVTEAVTEEAEKIILDAIPEGTDFGGKEIRVRINTFDQTQYESEIFMKGPDEADGDVVHDAILERNQRVEERLNVKFTYEIVDFTYDKVYPDLQKIIMAGDDVYDLIVDQQYGMLKVAADNMLYNFFESDVNDFSQVYWWEEYMDELQLNDDARFLVAGDYFLDVVEVASAIFFNKAMYQEHYEDAMDLYELAFDGKWTIDALGEYVKEFSIDVNGDGTLADGDVFAMNMSRNYMDAQVFGSGVVFMERGSDGYPVLNLEDPRITECMEKIVENYIEPNKTFNFGTVAGVTEAEYYQNQRTAFANRELLFLNDYLAAVKDLRDMKDDYG
ncbi:MAG: extracellular solute-binding protein, partial [Clostridia bacterium]|nr:extracellular solute-binding protein [Clostridia bacterium]